jgi:hypothetical protein
MESPEVKITFEWDGETVNKETSGFNGKSCTEVTAFIEDALAGKDQKRTFKSEYYRQEKQPLHNERLRQ